MSLGNLHKNNVTNTPSGVQISARSEYSVWQKLWHWLMALMLVVTFAIGLYMQSMAFSPLKIQFINYHKWMGIFVLAAACARLLNRLLRTPQPLPQQVTQSMPVWQKWAHKANIFLMYALFFAVPALGWAMSDAKGFPVVLFGALPLPKLIDNNPRLGAILSEAHEAAAFTLAALVIVHLLAVIKHQFINKDKVLQRMI